MMTMMMIAQQNASDEKKLKIKTKN